MDVDEIRENKDGKEYYGACLTFNVEMGDRFATVIVMDDGWHEGDSCPKDTRALVEKMRNLLVTDW
jgi:hypothetical protein